MSSFQLRGVRRIIPYAAGPLETAYLVLAKTIKQPRQGTQWGPACLVESFANAVTSPEQVTQRARLSKLKKLRFPTREIELLKVALAREYKLQDMLNENQNVIAPRPIWNVAANCWVRYSDRKLLKTVLLFPNEFGKALFLLLFQNEPGLHTVTQCLGTGNALLLPAPLFDALDEGALTIVPDIPDDPTHEQARQWANDPVKEYKFHVLDPMHPKLQQRITGISEQLVDVGRSLGYQLDQKRLCFPPDCDRRPYEGYMYFRHCCSLLSHYRNLVPILRTSFDENRQDRLLKMPQIKEELGDGVVSETAFSKAFQGNERLTKPIKVHYVWQSIIKDVRRLAAWPGTPLDWSVSLQTLRRREKEPGEFRKIV